MLRFSFRQLMAPSLWEMLKHCMTTCPLGEPVPLLFISFVQPVPSRLIPNLPRTLTDDTSSSLVLAIAGVRVKDGFTSLPLICAVGRGDRSIRAVGACAALAAHDRPDSLFFIQVELHLKRGFSGL